MRFFEDLGMDFGLRCLLSGVRDGTAEIGEVLVTADLIHDGNAESWLTEFCALGKRLAGAAAEAEADGRNRTAWGLSLRSANYLFGGAWWAPATDRRGDVVRLWKDHRESWDQAVALWPSPAHKFALDSPVGGLPAYWFNPASEAPVGAVVMIQGLDTPLSDAPMTGLSEALRRGYSVLLLEGPGQGEALLVDGLGLDQPWTGIVESAVGWVKQNSSGPVVVMGINHGSYFVLHSVASGLEVDAIVVDPAVFDLGGDLAAGADDQIMGAKLAMAYGALSGTPISAAQAADKAAELRFGVASLADVSAPMLVLSAEDAESFTSQSAAVAEVAGDNVTLHNFEAKKGAGLDCEIAAPQIRNAVVYDWIERVVSR